MNNLNLKNIIEELLDAFIIAGKIAKKISQQGVKITIKTDNTPVTDGDLAVDKILRKKISNLTPKIPIVSEETSTNKNKENLKNFWLIDPIDGTKEYIKKRDEYTLNAALISNLEPAAGIVYAPEKNRLFFSYGKGFAFEIYNGNKTILNCSKKNTSEIIGLTGSQEELLPVWKDFFVHVEPSIDSEHQNYLDQPDRDIATEPEIDNYMVQHTAFYYIFDRKNNLRSILPFGSSIEQMKEEIKTIK